MIWFVNLCSQLAYMDDKGWRIHNNLLLFQPIKVKKALSLNKTEEDSVFNNLILTLYILQFK